jgi:hypothetical protein
LRFRNTREDGRGKATATMKSAIDGDARQAGGAMSSGECLGDRGAGREVQLVRGLAAKGGVRLTVLCWST